MQQGIQHVALNDAEEVEAVLRALIGETLGLSESRIAAFDQSTALFGSLPELDSMAVATLLTGIEETFAVLIEDDDVEAEDFATFGSLLAFVKRIALR
jgi:acyl carrier protein